MSSLTKALLLLLLLTLMHVQPSHAGRFLKKEKQLKLQILDKGPVPPSGPSSCTYVPGTGGTNCPIDGINAAGNALHGHQHHNGHHGGAGYPRLVVPFTS
ncbi:hypothetical protein L6164_012857 [Bauhinia variegata]|uniref:Uncharacterized protein n=1 Tax=Bauhinia variegata TaxID=167791 RepID=A0ACB9PBN8_BAUVA|nr:hypothetical protein L6164_012857 [Bauhinia variegata]